MTAAAIAFVGGGSPTREIGLLVNPGVEIEEGATAVHGITNERVAEEGMPAAEAVNAIAGYLRGAVLEGWPIVAFNARFDLTILDRECRRHGVDPLVDPRVVDPFVIDKWLHRFRKGSRKLDAMCEHYGAKLDRDETHDATADAVAAARLAWVIAKRGKVEARMPELVPMRATWKRVRDDLGLLYACQVGWAHDQAVSLAEYFAKKGEPQVVETAWPVVPLEVKAEAA